MGSSGNLWSRINFLEVIKTRVLLTHKHGVCACVQLFAVFFRMELTVTVWLGNSMLEYTIPNMEPTSATPYADEKEVAAADKEIKDAIRTFSQSAHCQSSVRAGYVEERFEANSMFLVLNRGEEVQGFIMASVLGDGGIYLDIICSAPGTGRPFLNFFLAYCERHGAPYVELSSLLQVLGYYPPFGFQHRKECTPGKGANVAMSTELAEHIKAGTISKRLVKVDDFYGDPYILNFAWKLFQRDFSKTTDPDICTKKSITPGRFKQYYCARDGFTMRKCFGIPDADPLEVLPFKAVSPTVGKKRKHSAIRSKTAKANGKANGKAKAANGKEANNGAKEPPSKRTRRSMQKATKSTLGSQKSQKALPRLLLPL